MERQKRSLQSRANALSDEKGAAPAAQACTRSAAWCHAIVLVPGHTMSGSPLQRLKNLLPGGPRLRVLCGISTALLFFIPLASYSASPVNDAPGSTASDESSASAELSQMSLEQLMNVQVTSVSRRPQKLIQAAAAIQVITGEDIRRFGATSLPEALRLADNLEVAQISAHDWAISARGFNANLANKLLVLIDGRPVYTPLYGGVLWNVQDYPLSDIERIEVISGPGGTFVGCKCGQRRDQHHYEVGPRYAGAACRSGRGRPARRSGRTEIRRRGRPRALPTCVRSIHRACS